MTALFSAVAWASLIVAVGLLLLAVGAFVAASMSASETTRVYLEPLSTWCLIAVAVHIAGLAVAGDAGVLAYGLSVLLAGAAALLRPVRPQPAAPAPPPEEPAAPAAPPATVTPRAPLWAGTVPDEPGPRQGLWN